MTLAAYSTSLNVTPSVAAGNGLKGQAVCNPGSGFVVATTANRAAGTVDLGGVALEDFNTGGQFRIVSSGYVPADIVGALSGTGSWVNVDASGSLYRSTSSTSDTIGKYQSDGGVIVNLSLQSGGTANATQIQGVTVASASGARSRLLAGNGTALGSRRGVYNFLDWGPDETGASNAIELLRTAINEIPNYSDLYVPLPSSVFRVELTSTSGPIKFYDDNENGNRRGIRIIGEGGDAWNGGKYHFQTYNSFFKGGTAAKCTAYSNGGVGDSHQTWVLDAGSGVLQADFARWRGRMLHVSNAADNNNNGFHLIVDVPADNTVRVHNFNATPTATENGQSGSALSPTCVWDILEPILDIRAKDVTLQNLSFGLGANCKIDSFVDLNHAPGTSASTSYRNRIIGCAFANDNANSVSQYFLDAIKVARKLVPTVNTNFAWRGGSQNGVISPNTGVGEYGYGDPPQVDTNIFYGNIVRYAQRSGFAFYSGSAQAKENRIVECQFSALTTRPMQFAICAPRENQSATPAGNPHFDVYRCGFGAIRDACIQLGGYGSKNFIIQGCYSELSARLLNAATNSSPVNIGIYDCTMGLNSTYIHPSGAMVHTNGAGPLRIIGGQYAFGSDTVPWYLVRTAANSATLVNTIRIEDVHTQGTSTHAVRDSAQQTSFRGPHAWSGTEKLGVKIDGVQVDVAFTAGNFQTACGYAIDMNRAHTYEEAALIGYYVPAAAAWGDGDDVQLFVTSRTQTISGQTQIQAPGSGTDANTKLGFGVALTAHLAKSRLQKDSSGLVEWTSTAGTAGKVHLAVDAHLMNNASVSGTYVIVDKVINGAAGQGDKCVENIRGLSQTNGVPPANFWAEVPHVGGSGASFAWDATHGSPVFRAEEDNSYKVFGYVAGYSGGVPAAGYNEIVSIAYATSGATITTKADPGAGVTVTWHLEMRR